MLEITAPHFVSENSETPWLFLCGSIGMGKAEPWQSQVVKALKDCRGTILNPRRPDWDSSWEQSISNKQFYEQVTWELTMLERSHLTLVYFDPNTRSPITLLELGLFGKHNCIVCCPEGYFRKGNVDIVCERYRIRQSESLDELLNNVRIMLEV